ncbi:MAG: hypothetical protein WB421_09380 [Terriglobales bacterium]
MPNFKVAHVREQGQDMVIVPLDSGFGRKMSSEQQAIAAELQLRSRSAGLAGRVVPVWDNGGGRMGFVAPRNWHAFFAGLSLGWVFTNINRELYW